MKPSTDKPAGPKPCVRCKTPTRQRKFVCALCQCKDANKLNKAQKKP